MCVSRRQNLFLSAAFCLVISSAPMWAQSPSPSPSSSENGTQVTSSIELGVRGLSVNGDHDKYRSDLNYGAGFRLFDSSFLIENNKDGDRLFDNILLTGSGWGSDPNGSFRLNADRTGIYKLDSNVRRVRYFNNLKTHAISWSQPIPTGSEHRLNTLHHFGDFDLTVFPERDFRLRFGYSFNRTDGPGLNTIRFSGDEYAVDSKVKTRSDDFRAGVEGKLWGFNLGLNYGHRVFRDRSRFFVNGLNVGNNPASTTSFITNAYRQFDVDGATDYIHSFAQRTFARKLDFTARFIYAESKSEMEESDNLTGRASSTGNFIILDQIFVPGKSKRPQSRGDVGLTYRITDRLRVSNTFTFDQFNVGGANTLFESVTATTGAGVPVPTALTSTSSWRATSYRRFSNLLEADYQASRRFGFNVGYRFTNREVTVGLLDINLLTGALQRSGEEDLKNSTHTVMVGGKFKPTNQWSIYLDLERGQADNVFTRLANNDFFNFRARSIASIKRFTLNLSVITRDNDNPGTSVPITSGTPPVVIFPATETVANSKIRIFSGSVDWAPRSEIDFSAGYTYTHQTSKVDIIVPVGTPIFSSTRFLLGVSEYYVRDGFFFFDVTARPIKRVSLYASYRIDDDSGQGDRMITRPQDIITSYPIRFHMPEIRLALRLTRRIDWNLGYQYYSYTETPHFNPFPTPTVTFPAQNYTAHMPYTSVRIYLGRKAADR